MTSQTQSRKKIWKMSLRDGLPIAVGYLAVSFALGIQAAGIGMTPAETAMMSFLNLTSAGEFAGLGIIATGGSYLSMALSQLIINLRYLLMSTALSQKIDTSVKPGTRALMACGITDEIFALCATYPGTLPPEYEFGMTFIAVAGWTAGSFLGAFAGQILPVILINALSLAIYGMFIAIIVPESRKSRSVLIAVLISMALSTLFTYCPGLKEIPEGYRIIIVTVAVAGTAAALFPADSEEETADASSGSPDGRRGGAS